MTSCKQNNIHKIAQSPKNVFGVTLVELMVAITISSIVAIGIGSVYTTSKRNFKLQEEFSKLQENGRFGISYISRFARGAGFSGCASGISKIYNDINSTDDEVLFQTGLEGYEAAGTAPGQSGTTLAAYPSVSTTAANFTQLTSAGATKAISAATLTKLGALPGSDIFISRVAASTGVKLIEPNLSGTLDVDYLSDELNLCTITDPANPPNTHDVNGYSGICPDDYLIISDCSKAIAFQVSSLTAVGIKAGAPPANKLTITHDTTGTPGNILPAWGTPGQPANPGFDFKAGDEFLTVASKFFYVGNGTNGPSLFMKDGSATALELVEGVENMQVLYGVDTDDDNIPNRYAPADKITDFSKVTAVRLSVLLRSVQDFSWRTAASKPYLLGGTTSATAATITSPNDQRIRRVMNMTIKIRNRAMTI